MPEREQLLSERPMSCQRCTVREHLHVRTVPFSICHHGHIMCQYKRVLIKCVQANDVDHQDYVLVSTVHVRVVY